MKHWIGAVLIALILSGCGPKSSGATIDSPKPVENQSPAEKLREQLSSGAFQADAALESIADAFDKAKSLRTLASSAELQSASKEVSEILDDCGEKLGEFTDDAPPIAEIESHFARYDDSRLKAIEAANDSLHDLNEAHGILDSIIDGSSMEFATAARELDALILNAIDDVMGATKAFGGDIEVGD